MSVRGRAPTLMPRSCISSGAFATLLAHEVRQGTREANGQDGGRRSTARQARVQSRLRFASEREKEAVGKGEEAVFIVERKDGTAR